MAFEQGRKIGLKATPGHSTEGAADLQSAGKECSVCNKVEQGSVVHQDEEGQGHEQVLGLPTELLNHILSYTGTPAAVLAAGTTCMRTWSAQNIAEWLHQHYAHMDTEQAKIDALKQTMKHKLNQAYNILHFRLRKLDVQTVVELTETAAQCGLVSVVTQMLDMVSQGNVIKVNRLMQIACQHGQLQVVKALLDEAQPYACRPDDDNNSYLLTAVHYEHIAVVKELLDPTRKHCARANAQNSKALEQAATEGHLGVLLELLDTSREHHCNANDDNCSAFIAAARHGHLDCVRALLDTSRAKYAIADAADNMPLLIASLFGHLHIVKELLDTSRPNHTTADAHDSAALLAAARNGHDNILRELLCQEQHAADPMSVFGSKALEEAVCQGNLECCRLLLGYPDPPTRNVDESQLELAASSNNPEVLALLQEANRRPQPLSVMD